jgi:hypothetical protein
MTDVNTNEYVIIEMGRARLSDEIDHNGYGWAGKKVEAGHGLHLGIYDPARNADLSGAVAVLWQPQVRGNGGWGFGHNAHKDDKQAYSWACEPINKTVFEIAVKSTALTSDEAKRLLKK